MRDFICVKYGKIKKNDILTTKLFKHYHNFVEI